MVKNMEKFESLTNKVQESMMKLGQELLTNIKPLLEKMVDVFDKIYSVVEKIWDVFGKIGSFLSTGAMGTFMSWVLIAILAIILVIAGIMLKR